MADLKQSTKIITWNANGLRGGLRNKLDPLLIEYEPDIVLIQEAHLDNKSKINIPKYRHHLLDCNKNQKYGLLTLFRDNLYAELISQSDNEQGQIMTSKIYLDDKTPITVTNIYRIQTVKEPNVEQIKAELTNETKDHIISGDFNLKHNLWDKNRSHQIPRKIDTEIANEIITNTDIFLLNNGEVTRTAQNISQTDSTIDLTIIKKPEKILDWDWSTLPDTFESDHVPLLTAIETKANYEPIRRTRIKYKKEHIPKLKENLKNVDWEKLNEIKDNNELYEAYKKELTKTTLESLPHKKPGGSTTKTKNPRHKHTPWFNEKCKTAIKNRRYHLKKKQKEPTIENYNNYRKARNEATEIIRKEREKYWKYFVTEELNVGTNAKKVFNVVKAIQGKPANTKIGKILDNNKQEIIGDQNKAEHIANIYEQISSDQNLDPDFKLIKENFEEYHQTNIKQKEQNNNSDYNKPFSMRELKAALRYKKHKATGEDGLSYIVFQNLPTSGKQIMLRIFNHFYETGEIPQELKHAIAIPIPKEGKDPKIANNYRPISLTSHLGKILETMVNKRLKYELDKKGIIQNNQAGFRNKRSTHDNIIQLAHSIEESMRYSKCNVAITLDLEKAFDTVSREGILLELKKNEITGNMYNYVLNFLSERTFQVRVNEGISTTKKLENGVPQGSVISPTLFNIIMNAVDDPGKKCGRVKSAKFADDMATWLAPKTAPYKKSIKKGGKGYKDKRIREIEQATTELIKNLKSKGFKVNTEKTQATIFNTDEEIELNIDGKQIKTKPTLKYLGVTFDKHLKYKDHIDNLHKKAVKSLYALKLVSGKKRWGPNTATKKTIYNNLILSKMTYGEEVYYRAGKNTLEKLDRIQSTAIRCISQIHNKKAGNLAQNVLTQIPPLEIRRKRRIAELAFRLDHNETNPARDILREEMLDNKIKSKPSFQTTAHNLLKQHNLKLEEQTTYTNTLDIWNYPEIPTDMTIKENMKCSKKETDPIKLKNETLEHINNNYPTHKLIYTDGSKLEETVGAGFYCSDGHEETVRITDNTSITTAEQQAVLMALKHINNEHKNEKIAICTDSLATIKSINNDRHQSRQDITDQIQKEHKIATEQNRNTIAILWIPSHIGIIGNDKADTLANRGRQKETKQEIRLGPGEIKCKIKRELTQKLFQKSWDENITKGHRHNQLFYEIFPKANTKINNTHRNILFNKLRLGVSKHNVEICEICQTDRTNEHMLIECPKFENNRNRVKNNLEKQNLLYDMKTILKPRHKKYTKKLVNILIESINKEHPI